MVDPKSRLQIQVKFDPQKPQCKKKCCTCSIVYWKNWLPQAQGTSDMVCTFKRKIQERRFLPSYLIAGSHHVILSSPGVVWQEERGRSGLTGGVVTLSGVVQISSGRLCWTFSSVKHWNILCIFVTLAKVNVKGVRIYCNHMSKLVKFDLNSM